MRQHGWDTRLFDYVDSHRKTAFEWGVFDCCLFPAGCVEAMTGTDFAANLRGYRTEAEAKAIIAKYGSMQAMVTALLGTKPIHPAFAQRGDVLLAIQGDGSESLRICLGAHSAMPAAAGAVGLVFRPVSEARYAWKV